MCLAEGLLAFLNTAADYLNEKKSQILGWFGSVANYLCYLLDNSCNDTEYVGFIGLMLVWTSVIKNDSTQQLLIWSIEKKSEILSQMNWLICFHWAIGSVNYWILSAMRQITLIALINSVVKK